MNINIVCGYGLNDVRQIKRILGTKELPILNNSSNEFELNKVNIFVADYTPMETGNILIKYPDNVWVKLRINSKIVNHIMKQIEYKTPHYFKNQNVMASIQLSKIKSIEIKDENEF